MNRICNFHWFPLFVLLSSGLFLAGCESDEEKAERYFQSGVDLLAAGDDERALVEFRNVFKYDGFHKEARQTYADILLEKGRSQEAYSQYLRLIEQYPDTVEVRRTLAEFALSSGNWDEAERHGNAAIALAPEQPAMKAIALALAYRDAAVNRDTAARSRLAGEAATVLEEMRASGAEDNAALVRIVIDSLINANDPDSALAALDAAIGRDPDARDLNLMKARLLDQIGDTAGTGVQLKKMVEVFPEDRELQQALINWYLGQQDIDGAEAFLRQLAGPETGPPDGHVSVVQLLKAGRGTDAARDELTRLIMANEGKEAAVLYTALLAALDFESGATEKAIADLSATLDGAEASEQTRRLQIMLAQMLEATDASDDARALVKQVLEGDASNVAALKMQARWLIDKDQPGEAIVALRSALNQNPRDTETLTLLAAAHERDGDTELMGERLALAVEVSGAGVAESIRYADFLMTRGRQSVATSVLEDARRSAPANIDILRLLADIRLRNREWSHAQNIAQSLREVGTPSAQQVATELQARILQGRDRTEDSLAFLEGQISNNEQTSENQTTRAVVQIVQTQIRANNVAAARAYLDEAHSQSPENADLQLLDASLHALMGEMDEAADGYRGLIDRFPTSELPVRLLISVLTSTGKEADAAAILSSALERMPTQPNLLWIQASLLERDGDIAGAIGIYEQLYSRNSSSMVIANNLASLITTYRDDPKDLQRAATIARRLRGTEVPAFQDTYGWIAYRRGNLEEAVEYLEPAAAALSNDPTVQYHLGMTYAGMGQTEKATEMLNRALEIAGDSPMPQFQTARDKLAELSGEQPKPDP